jgi:SPW repeat-containing protein
VSEGLAQNWWFWALAVAALAGLAGSSGRYRLLAARLRRAAVRRGLVDLPPGRALAHSAGGFWSDLSWLVLYAGAWVILSPWIWGYEEVEGAIATDAITGAAVIAIALAGIVFPALWALNILAGLWLVTAPWLVGYGDANGPVGLSDTVAGLVIAATAIATLAAAERRIRPGGGPGAIGRIRPRE